VAYFDGPGGTQVPADVVDAMADYLVHHNANTHWHYPSSEETDRIIGDARAAVADFLNGTPAEVAFGANMTTLTFHLARALGRGWGPTDEIVVTEMEHHANLVPWQRACARSGATLRWLPLTDDGRLDLSGLDDVVTERTRVLAFTHVSNVLGTVNPVAALVERAKAVGALTVLDACQSVPHQRVDLAALGVDLAVFSAHKMLGPTGIGALAGRREVLDALPPFLTGGSMVETVTMDSATFRPAPQRFEAGTPPVSQAVAWHAAVDYLTAAGLDRINAHEHALTERLLAGVAGIAGVRVLGPATTVDRAGAVSVVVDGVHPHDVGQLLDNSGIAVRVGHHCAQPVHRRFGATATTRASVYLYNTVAEVDRFLDALSGVRAYFGVA